MQRIASIICAILLVHKLREIRTEFWKQSETLDGELKSDEAFFVNVDVDDFSRGKLSND